MARRYKAPEFNPEVDDISKPSFTVFSDVDFIDNRISSTYPTWFFDSMKEVMQNEITRMENAVRFGWVPADRYQEFSANLRELKSRYQSIIDAERKFGPKVVDFVTQKVLPTLSEKISNSMFTRAEMEKGLVDPSEEARRMTTPCITLNDSEVRWAQACNVRVVNGNVSRTDAEKMWKIARKIVGEGTNVEVLRK